MNFKHHLRGAAVGVQFFLDGVKRFEGKCDDPLVHNLFYPARSHDDEIQWASLPNEVVSPNAKAAGNQQSTQPSAQVADTQQAQQPNTQAADTQPSPQPDTQAADNQQTQAESSDAPSPSPAAGNQQTQQQCTNSRLKLKNSAGPYGWVSLFQKKCCDPRSYQWEAMK